MNNAPHTKLKLEPLRVLYVGSEYRKNEWESALSSQNSPGFQTGSPYWKFLTWQFDFIVINSINLVLY